LGSVTSNPVYIATNSTTAVTIDTSQNVGIGTSSPAVKLDLAGANQTTIARTYSGSTSFTQYIDDSAGGVYLAANTASGTNAKFLAFQTVPSGGAATERMRIDSSGNLLVGKGSTGNNGRIQSQAAGGTSFDTYEGFSNTGGFTFAVSGAGQIYAVSTTISAISDERLKENIRDLDDGLQTVMALKPRKYDWKEGKGADTKNARGFIAQEFETVFPDLIDEWREPAPEGQEPYKSVRQDLIPVLVKAIQEQQALITDMAAKLKSAGVAGF